MLDIRRAFARMEEEGKSRVLRPRSVDCNFAQLGREHAASQTLWTGALSLAFMVMVTCGLANAAYRDTVSKLTCKILDNVHAEEFASSNSELRAWELGFDLANKKITRMVFGNQENNHLFDVPIEVTQEEISWHWPVSSPNTFVLDRRSLIISFILASVNNTVASLYQCRVKSGGQNQINSLRISGIGGVYDVYQAGPPHHLVARMSITNNGDNISAQGLDQPWAGRGKIQGSRGFYDWRFTDGRSGRVDFGVEPDGSLQGHVVGSGLDWWYSARRIQYDPGATANSAPPASSALGPPSRSAVRAVNYVFICRDLGGRNPNGMVLTVDPADRTFVDEETSAISHTKCTFIYKDGAYGLMTVGPSAQYCGLAMGGTNMHQRVIVTHDQVTAKAYNDQGEGVTFTLEFGSGILRTSNGDTAECHAARAR